MPNAISGLANERSTAVALTRVLAFLASGAQETRVQRELRTKPRPPEHVLALPVVQHGQVDLLEDVLVRAAGEGVLAPPGDVAPLAGKVLLVVGQAHGADVGVPAEVDIPVEPDHSDVVVQVAGVELVVDKHVGGVKLDVSVELGVVVDVPFAKPNSAQASEECDKFI